MLGKRDVRFFAGIHAVTKRTPLGGIVLVQKIIANKFGAYGDIVKWTPHSAVFFYNISAVATVSYRSVSHSIILSFCLYWTIVQY